MDRFNWYVGCVGFAFGFVIWGITIGVAAVGRIFFHGEPDVLTTLNGVPLMIAGIGFMLISRPWKER